MLPKNRIPTHPGEILLEEFLNPLGVSQTRFAEHIGVQIQRVNEIVRGRRGVSSASAWLFAEALGTTPEFWMNLQALHDLAQSRPSKAVGRLRRTACRGTVPAEVPVREAVAGAVPPHLRGRRVRTR